MSCKIMPHTIIGDMYSQIYIILTTLTEDFALRVPPFHSRGTVRLTLMVPSISERWYWYQASEMSAVKRCSITDVA